MIPANTLVRVHRIRLDPTEVVRVAPLLELGRAVPVATMTEPVAETVEGKEATVGDGAVPSAPFIARALEDRVAKPTEAGLAR